MQIRSNLQIHAIFQVMARGTPDSSDCYYLNPEAALMINSNEEYGGVHHSSKFICVFVCYESTTFRARSAEEKKMNKSPCSSRCGLTGGHAAGRSPSPTSKVLLFIPRPLGIISRRPCPRVRPRRHATQRARSESHSKLQKPKTAKHCPREAETAGRCLAGQLLRQEFPGCS